MNKSRNYRLPVLGGLVLVLAASLTATDPASATDGQRPVYPLPVCQTVDQAQCQAVLTNRWDGRAVVHELTPVPVCTSRPSPVLVERLERRAATIDRLRDKVARLRARHSVR